MYNSMNCICCDKLVEDTVVFESAIPGMIAGAYFRIDPGYGSRFDDNGNDYKCIAVICDDCIEKNAAKIHKYKTVTKTTSETTKIGTMADSD